MVHIKKVKTFTGELRYAVVDEHKSTTKDLEDNVVTNVEYLPVDYRVGEEVYPAVFPLTDEGLEKAKEIQKIYKKRKK